MKEALSHLLNVVFEDRFLDISHGFRKGRGHDTFFMRVRMWGPVDKLIKTKI